MRVKKGGGGLGEGTVDLEPLTKRPNGRNRSGLADSPRYIAMMMRCFLRYLRRRHRKFQEGQRPPKTIFPAEYDRRLR